jgi:peroxiredoxin
MTRLIAFRSIVVSPCGVTVTAVCLALATMLGCQNRDSSKPGDSTSPPATKSEGDASKTEAKPTTGREVLARMVDAYRKASSYADMGTVRLLAEADGKKFHDQTAPFSLAFAQPNKLHINAYAAEMVCDGQNLYAYVRHLPGQVLSRPAPKQWTLRNIHPDMLIMDRMTQGFAGSMPQIPLLFGKNALDVFLRDMDEPKLVEPGEINGRECYRVKLKSPDGVATFWVDQQSYALRRIVFPTDGLRAAMSQDSPIDNISLVADFTGAELNGDVNPEAFQFEVPKDAKLVDFLMPPLMGQWLNKKAPEFKLTDLSGKPIAFETLTGKTTVILFWSFEYDTFRQSLKDLEQAHQKFKDDPKVAFCAVCVDPAQRKDADLKKVAADLQLQTPVFRDLDRSAATAFNAGELPATIIINDKGIVQHCEAGFDPRYAELLQTRLRRALAGEDISEEATKQYLGFVDNLQKYAKAAETAAAEPKPGDNVIAKEERLPEVKTAPPSEPTTFKLAPLWKSTELKSPGNILVLAGKAGPERLLVVDGMNLVAEVNLAGKVVASHNLNLEGKELIGNLRTGLGADGRRYFAAFLMSHQRCHVFDEKWNLVAHYPEDALKNPHSGITDVRFADLDGDGRVKLYVSYWGVVGVQAVSLDGNRLWANRSVSNVACMAVGGPDAKGSRDLFCTTGSNGLAVLDGKGARRGEVTLRNRFLNCMANADLRGNGELLWCGLAAVKIGDNTAIGFSLAGDDLWEYSLPTGFQPQPIERIIPGRISRDGPGQWLLPGPDGSIHILSADGKPLDKFNYGAVLQGLATLEIDGRPVLIVASPKGLEAWRIE